MGLKWEAMDEDLRMNLVDLGEGGGGSEQGEEHDPVTEVQKITAI